MLIERIKKEYLIFFTTKDVFLINKFKIMKKITFLFSALLLMQFSIAYSANVQLTVKLKNGDVVTGKTVMSKLTMVTPYGSLLIPVEKVSNLKLGLISDHSKDQAVNADLKKMQTASEQECKVIYDRLLGFGTTILSTIINFSQDPSYKISDNENYTIESLLDELYKMANLSYGESVNDAITFDGVNYIEGSVLFGDITIQAEYGNLTFKREKIESLEIYPIEEAVLNADGSYKLKANYHISGNDNKGWVNTGVKVKSGEKFMITAYGKIVLKSLSGGTYGPDGYVTGVKDGAYTDDMETKYGSVIYKIGEYGDIRTAGSKLDGIADSDGTIYISIYETVFDKLNTGSYTVKVNKK